MSKIQFRYPDFDDHKLAEIKQLSGIDISDCTHDLSKARIITEYVHALFDHDGDNQPSSFDAMTVLKEAKAGAKFRCVEYSFLAVWLLLAHGIYARVVGLKTEDVETREYGAGHVVIEYWDVEASTWIMCDVQAGLMFTDDNHRHLSAYELRGYLGEGKTPLYMPVEQSHAGREGVFGRHNQDYSKWVNEYLYFIDTFIYTKLSYLNGLAPEKIAMLVPDGAANPIMFQNAFEMNALYVDSPEQLYASPIPNNDELDSLKDAEGRIMRWPKKQAGKELVISYLATKFSKDQVYNESEVNELLKQWHTFTDWPLLRRELVERGYITRNKSGSSYNIVS